MAVAFMSAGGSASHGANVNTIFVETTGCARENVRMSHGGATD
jgi:hypothetical protein